MYPYPHPGCADISDEDEDCSVRPRNYPRSIRTRNQDHNRNQDQPALGSFGASGKGGKGYHNHTQEQGQLEEMKLESVLESDQVLVCWFVGNIVELVVQLVV